MAVSTIHLPTRAVTHLAYTGWSIGGLTLLMHNHVHNNGVLKKQWRWLDMIFPYTVEPLVGHTWDSYHYHHVKVLYVENNGMLHCRTSMDQTDMYATQDQEICPLRYDTNGMMFCASSTTTDASSCSYGQGFLCISSKEGRQILQCVFIGEVSSYTFYIAMYRLSPRATLWMFLISFALLRFALMVGNWDQHALVDEVDLSSDFRTSITMINVIASLPGHYLQHSGI